jgi:hypothetical protein
VLESMVRLIAYERLRPPRLSAELGGRKRTISVNTVVDRLLTSIALLIPRGIVVTLARQRRGAA